MCIYFTTTNIDEDDDIDGTRTLSRVRSAILPCMHAGPPLLNKIMHKMHWNFGWAFVIWFQQIYNAFIIAIPMQICAVIAIQLAPLSGPNYIYCCGFAVALLLLIADGGKWCLPRVGDKKQPKNNKRSLLYLFDIAWQVALHIVVIPHKKMPNAWIKIRERIKPVNEMLSPSFDRLADDNNLDISWNLLADMSWIGEQYLNSKSHLSAGFMGTDSTDRIQD